MPLISVIVPVFNTEQYIRRCIDSILSQTFKDFELIIVDDGSVDNSGAICDEYAKKDDRVKVFHQDNQGQAAARNYALDWVFANIDSNYISFVDSDDWVHPFYLERLLYAIKKDNIYISQCVYKITESKIPFIEIKKSDDNLYLVSPEEEYTKWYSANFWGKLFKKECFNILRFPAGVIFEDVSIWYKLLFSVERIAIIDETLYYYFQRHDNTTNSNWTPAKLTQIDAWEEQVRFAYDYGNEDVLQTALEKYIWVCKHQCKEIKTSNQISEKQRKEYYSIITKKIRSFWFKHRTELKERGLLSQYSSCAFPKLNGIYWTIRGICGKIKRLFNE